MYSALRTHPSPATVVDRDAHVDHVALVQPGSAKTGKPKRHRLPSEGVAILKGTQGFIVADICDFVLNWYYPPLEFAIKNGRYPTSQEVQDLLEQVKASGLWRLYWPITG